jgi:hypothetical protein
MPNQVGLCVSRKRATTYFVARGVVWCREHLLTLKVDTSPHLHIISDLPEWCFTTIHRQQRVPPLTIFAAFSCECRSLPEVVGPGEGLRVWRRLFGCCAYCTAFHSALHPCVHCLEWRRLLGSHRPELCYSIKYLAGLLTLYGDLHTPTECQMGGYSQSDAPLHRGYHKRSRAVS